jgi:hypothetical protein
VVGTIQVERPPVLEISILPFPCEPLARINDPVTVVLPLMFVVPLILVLPLILVAHVIVVAPLMLVVELRVAVPLMFTVPFTSSLAHGVLVQIPTLPVASTLIRWFPSPSAMIMLFERFDARPVTLAPRMVLATPVVIPRAVL